MLEICNSIKHDSTYYYYITIKPIKFKNAELN